MPASRSTMRTIREVLRLKYESGLSHERIAAACGISKGAVTKYLQRARAAGMQWPVPSDRDDSELANAIFGRVGKPTRYAEPDYAAIHLELKRKGVTLQLLWGEYRAAHPGSAYQYTQFSVLYRRWFKSQARSMRQSHRAGEKCFLDYAGPTVSVIDGKSGEIRPASIFVAVLGASSYTYAEASLSQSLPEWIGANVRALEFFGGVPEILVPDNLKAAVTRACRYEPKINRSYQEMASHYGTVVIPARPYKPKDKAKVEVGVQVVERWILARLRNRQFFSLGELNQAIRGLLTDLNERAFKKLPGSRASAFYEIDRPALKPLPEKRYEYAEWTRARAGIDYHIDVEGHYYSVPHVLVKQILEVRISARLIECFASGKPVASHLRSARRGAHTTVAQHMPKAHQKHRDWSPTRLQSWAGSIGPATQELVTWQLTHKPHPEQGYRSCLGLLQLARRFGEARLEAACRLTLSLGTQSRASVNSILQAGLDQHPELAAEAQALAVPAHPNLRGAGYYH
ncbi:MAG: IS21 family transposase [Deltaproteobacteria bacterium]|nr:IS21 family transposase [Deltaproteobacteria bacterium]